MTQRGRERGREKSSNSHWFFPPVMIFSNLVFGAVIFLEANLFFFLFDFPSNVQILSIVVVKCNERAIINCKIMKTVYDVKKLLFFTLRETPDPTEKRVKRK